MSATAGRTAARATSDSHLGLYLEAGAIHGGHVIHGDVLGALMKLFVDEQSKAIHIEHFVRFFGFIQNQCQ